MYRYVELGPPIGGVNLLVGLRDPLAGHDTPIWLRLHNQTWRAAEARERMMAAYGDKAIVDEEGHLCVPYVPPFGERQSKAAADLASTLDHLDSVILGEPLSAESI